MILTKFAGPTNHNGSRVIARCDDRRIHYSWNHALGTYENHKAAAEQLAAVVTKESPYAAGAKLVVLDMHVMPDFNDWHYACITRWQDSDSE